MHFFCYSCIRAQAETQVGLMHYELKCFDINGCQAAFDRKNMSLALDNKLMKKLEDLQQMDEIAKASIDGLEECPFCEFKGICLPVEQDKEFNCQNPECEKVSCRLCKEETHIPLSCKEAKKEKAKERSFAGRHAVEEAMTEALIRSCPKCKLPIIKEAFCNKLTCPKCKTLICDVCKKDITKKGYDHFHKGSCALHENDSQRAAREKRELAQAEGAAIDLVLAKNRGIDPGILQVSNQASPSKNKHRKSSAQH